MKLIFRQYLASLRERHELDAVLPDLLSELGYNVISRPTVGVRQFGVDVAALGVAEDRRRKLYLFSIKQGDLTRADWDGGTPQALRSSINEILDVYIPSRIAKAHEKLDVVICLCFGGDIQEAVLDNVRHFTKAHTTERISFEEWNGDYMAELLVKGVLREQLVDRSLRTSFKKAVAMVDEPDISFKHFAVVLRGLCSADCSTPKRRATIVRQIYICLWVLFIWSRDAENLECPYRASELALLLAWHLIRGDVGKSTKSAEEVSTAFSDLGNLHDIIWEALIGEKILPFVDTLHTVSLAVGSSASADISLKLFEVLGRVSMQGLWMLWQRGGGALPAIQDAREFPRAVDLAKKIVLLIGNNPILLTPITDSQSVDICVTFLFLAMLGECREGAASYVENLIQRTRLAFRLHKHYPTMHEGYRDLIDHPRERTDEYRESQTKGSTLFPLLAVWASSLGKADAADELAAFAREFLKHCNMQYWLPDLNSEEKLYRGELDHGVALNHIPISADGVDAIRILDAECAGKTAFNELSAVRYGHWPIVAARQSG